MGTDPPRILASPGQVAAAQDALGCRRVTPHPFMSHCDRPAHGGAWTDRGCPLAVATADAVRNAR